ncbi:MAG: hypothetical protein AAGB13_07370 [Cyanobacteria bacterium P01_F01_bin.33]
MVDIPISDIPPVIDGQADDLLIVETSDGTRVIRRDDNFVRRNDVLQLDAPEINLANDLIAVFDGKRFGNPCMQPSHHCPTNAGSAALGLTSSRQERRS